MFAHTWTTIKNKEDTKLPQKHWGIYQSHPNLMAASSNWSKCKNKSADGLGCVRIIQQENPFKRSMNEQTKNKTLTSKKIFLKQQQHTNNYLLMDEDS